MVTVESNGSSTGFAVALAAVRECGYGEGTLSDRLNPDHPAFDAAFQTMYRGCSKKERKVLVDADRAALRARDAALEPIAHPFTADADDHCETSAEAYGDITPLLRELASVLGRTAATLRIYDPFYCNGAVIRHLGRHGFTTVYNRCEDFYAVQAAGGVPEHDVVITNPPYSGEHPVKLLRWCRANGKPFLLLMPNYFIAKPYYDVALGGGTTSSMLYAVPKKRYNYWTPRQLRHRSKVQTQHAGADGYRTSPFISFWYLDLSPAMNMARVKVWWEKDGKVNPNQALLYTIDNLPKAVRPGENG
jgi:hypothetical protein